MKIKKLMLLVLFVILYIPVFSQQDDRLEECMQLEDSAIDNCLLNLIDRLITENIKLKVEVKSLYETAESQRKTINDLRTKLALANRDLLKMKADFTLSAKQREDTIAYYEAQQKKLIAINDTLNKKFISHTENIGITKNRLAEKKNTMQKIALTQSFSLRGVNNKGKSILLEDNYRAKQIKQINVFFDEDVLKEFETIPKTITVDFKTARGTVELETITHSIDMNSILEPAFYSDFKKCTENATYTFTIEIIDYPFYVPTVTYDKETNTIIQGHDVIYENIEIEKAYDFKPK